MAILDDHRSPALPPRAFRFPLRLFVGALGLARLESHVRPRHGALRAWVLALGSYACQSATAPAPSPPASPVVEGVAAKPVMVEDEEEAAREDLPPTVQFDPSKGFLRYASSWFGTSWSFALNADGSFRDVTTKHDVQTPSESMCFTGKLSSEQYATIMKEIDELGLFHTHMPYERQEGTMCEGETTLVVGFENFRNTLRESCPNYDRRTVEYMNDVAKLLKKTTRPIATPCPDEMFVTARGEACAATGAWALGEPGEDLPDEVERAIENPGTVVSCGLPSNRFHDYHRRMIFRGDECYMTYLSGVEHAIPIDFSDRLRERDEVPLACRMCESAASSGVFPQAFVQFRQCIPEQWRAACARIARRRAPEFLTRAVQQKRCSDVEAMSRALREMGAHSEAAGQAASPCGFTPP